MGTDFQEVYDCYQSKVNEDITGKEGLIFEFLKSALSKSKKVVNHTLQYELWDKMVFDGYFINTLDQEEIEYIALWMAYETKRRRKDKLETLRTRIGTKDFDKLPDKVKEFNAVSVSMKDLKEEIEELKQDFYTYTG